LNIRRYRYVFCISKKKKRIDKGHTIIFPFFFLLAFNCLTCLKFYPMNDFFTYKRFLLYFRAILLIIFFVNQGKAQNITATIGSFNSTTCAVGDTLVLPVSTVMGTGISVSAISLAIDYDTTKLQCISTVTGLNSAISAGFLSNCGLFSNQSPNAPYSAATRRQFRAAWFALTPVTVNGAMFNLRFRVLATGSTSINWDVATPGNCEFADELAEVIPNIAWVNSTIVCGTAAPCTPPLASITAAGPTTFCQGSSVVLNANTGTGLTYQWALNGTGIPGATNASYSATTAGSHTVVVSNAPNCSTVSAGTTVTVTTPPTVGTLSGNQAVCVAGTTTFASTVSGGTWSSSANGVATINASTGLLTGVAAGTATMTYTVAGTGGCANATATRTITVTAAPSAGTLSGNQAVCVASTTTFTSTVSGGTWSSSATGVATINASTGLVTGVSAGTATMTYTRSGTGGCANATATRTVTVTPSNTIALGSASGTNAQTLTLGAAITNITYTTTGATGATFSGLPAGVTGTWASNTATISGTPTAAGTFNYTVTMTGGCTGGTNTATGNITINAPAGPNIATSIAAVTGCIGDTISVPVTINMASGISTAAISMAIDFDTTKLQCINAVTSLNSAISAGFLSNCGLFNNLPPNAPFNDSTRRQFRAAWFNLTPVAFNGLMFNVRFKILAAGTHSLQWDTQTPGNCEYADEFADVIPNTTWNNGTVGLASGCATPCTPPISTITPAGPTTFCQGGSVVLNANSGTGLTYQWALNGTNISGATNSSYTATTAGSYTVLVFNAPTCSTVSAATTITVTPPPTAGILSGNQSVCISRTNTFTSTVSGGTWTSSATNIATVNATSGLVTGIAAGTVTITYTVTGTGGCANATATLSLTVLPTTTSTLRDSICPGSFYVFGQDTLRVPGFYQDTLVASNGCDSIVGLTLTQNTVPQTPIINSADSTICPGDTANLRVIPSSAFLTYRWFKNGIPVQGLYGLGVLGTSGSRYLANEPGNYSVLVTNSQGCQSTPSVAYSVNLLSNLPPQISQQPVNVTVNIGDTAVISIQTNNFDSIQWQYQPSGSSVWLNANSNSGIAFFGGNTTTLKFLVSSPSFNGLAFRAVISSVSRCTGNLTSNLSILTVNQLIATVLKIDSIQRCQANRSDTILVSVFANQFNNVGLANFEILKSSGLSFIGIENRNPALFTLNTQTSGDTITISGFGSSTGVTLPPNSILFKLKLVLSPGLQGILGLSWVPQRTYLSDPLQGQWLTSLINGGLTILPNQSTQLNQAICEGQTYAFGSLNLDSSGTYFRAVPAANGCDSIITLSLIVNPRSTTNLIRGICTNQTFNFGGQSLSTSGNYSDTLLNVFGCDSIINLQLIVDSIIANSISQRICLGDTFLFDTRLLTVPGVYQNNYVAASGCDSIVTLTLQFYNIDTTAISEFICLGRTFAFGSLNLDSAGTYFRTLTAANGCDSIIRLNLSVRPNATATISESICQGQSFSFGSQSLTTAGTYNRTVTAANGCDSVITLNLSVRPNATAFISQSICQGQSFSFGSQSLTTAGTYNRTVTAANGCDSVITLNLSVRPNATASISQSICQGQSFSFGSQSLTTAGTYNRTVTAANGCDSVITLNLSVRPNATATISQSICQGQSFSFGSQSLTTAGTFSRTISAANGCDSVITLSLSVRPNATASISQSICQGQSFSFGSQSLTTAGTYNRTITAANGCDSVITLNLSVRPNATASISQSICQGQSFSFGSQSLTTAGTYNRTITAANGCDSVITLNLSVRPNATASFSESICQGQTFSFGSQSLTTAGTYNRTVTAANGCDSVITLNLSVRPNATASISQSICQGQSFSFGSQSLTTAGTYNRTVTAANGCDSVITLNLSVRPNATATISQSICQGQSFSFGSQSLTTAGTFSRTISAANGCDSVITLSLSVRPNATASISQSICQGQSFSFGSQSLTTAGTYNRTITAANGCDSVITLNLSVRPNATASISQSICQGQSFSFGSQSLTTAGTYNRTITAANGCDSVITLNLTVSIAPDAGSISGLQNICVNATTTFSSTATGGSWSSSTPAVATVNATTGLVTGLTAGTATITYTVVGTGGCANATATRTVTVTAAPSAGTLSGSQGICVNGTSIFASTISGGAWSSSTPAIATVNANTGLVTGLTAGTATITYTITGTGGCANATATRTVTVTTAPTAGTLGGNQSICVSGTSTFTSTISGGAWSSNTPAVATVNATSGLVTGISAGTATITYTVTGTGGCSNATETRTVTVTATIAGTLSGIQGICVNGTSTFASTVTGGSWSSSAPTIATVNPTTGLVTGVAAGNATITYTVTGTGGCANATATRTVTVTATPSTGTLSGNQNICVNQTSTFASTVSGGSWSSSDPTIATVNASSGLVTGVAAGNATITYTVNGTGGCSNATATRTVTVTATTAGTLSGTQAICVNGTSAFTSTVSGGSWSSSSTSIATVNASSGVVTGVAAGTATITYTVIGTGGCANATATRTVTVTAAPNAGTLSGNQNICANGTTTFVSTAAGGTWSSSAPGIASVNANSGVVTGVTSGTATITYTVVGTGGCADATATRSITVRAVANTNITDTICQGSTYTFRNRTLSQAGVYRDTLASFNSCDSIITLNLTVLAKPSRPTIRVSATGDTLFATPSSNINWYRNGQPLLGGTNGILLINQNGIYFALQEVTFGLRTCYSDTSNILNVTNVGIDLPNSPNISAYPIPTSSTLNIRGILEQEPVELHMLDISGREVTRQWYLADRSESTITLDVSDLAGGIYQLKIKTLNSSETYFVRFIKSH
jgi:uncharacterized protein YjdB